jgi:hypothetical protein
VQGRVAAPCPPPLAARSTGAAAAPFDVLPEPLHRLGPPQNLVAPGRIDRLIESSS